jgi:hypothetical protein
MSPYASSSLFTQNIVVKPQDSPSPPHAQSGQRVGGGVRRDSQYKSFNSSSSSKPRVHGVLHGFLHDPCDNIGAFTVCTMPSGQKRSASDDSNGTPAKQIKTEQPEEFSNAVKKRLQSSSRTGQACDRCKVSATASGIHKDRTEELIASVDSKNPMRWTSRRMLTMFTEQYRMPDDRSHYRSSHLSRLCRRVGTTESRPDATCAGIGTGKESFEWVPKCEL